MAKQKADIELLNQSIETLNGGAGNLFALIDRASDALDRATTSSEKSRLLSAKVTEAMRESAKAVQDTSASLAADQRDFIEEVRGVATEAAEAREGFQRRCLKDGEILRDSLQTDLIQTKTDLTARFGALSAEVVQSVERLSQRLSFLEESATKELAVSLGKARVLTLISAILGVVNVVLLLALLLR